MVGERVEMLHCPVVGTIINHRTPTQATKTRMVPSDRPIEQVRRAPFSPMAPRRSTRTAYARWNGRVCTSSVGATTSSTFSDDARFAARRRRSESTLSSIASYESFFPATFSSMSTSTTSAESLPFGVLRSDVSGGAGSPPARRPRLQHHHPSFVTLHKQHPAAVQQPEPQVSALQAKDGGRIRG